MWNYLLKDIKIIGIDPGTQHLGLAIGSVDSYSYQIRNIEVCTYKAVQLPTYDKHLSYVHGDLTARVKAYRDFLYHEFCRVQPTLIASESPFFYRTHPGAYGPLVETLAAIREAVWLYDNTLPLYTVPPSNVKQAIGAKGNAKKEDMIDALERFSLFGMSKERISQLDEHGIDACAVMAALYKDRFIS